MTFEQRYVQARRRFIEADFANLNDMQRKAVLATEGPLLLLAGAGSGKTTVLIHRIANLIQYGRGSDTDEVPDTATEADLALLERTDLTPDERRRAQRAAALEPVEPWRIIAITFTNKAADELKDRIERMLGPEAAADIWASTFHSACVRILRRDADKLGYPNSFTIYDTSDSQAVVKRILKEMNLDEKAFPYRAVLTEISRAKEFIRENYADSAISLHRGAEKVGFSPNHFSTVFSQETGQTFVEYLTAVRIEAAKHLLTKGNSRMSDIVFDVGYQDSHYFSYLFKKHVGVSPREYRSRSEEG